MNVIYPVRPGEPVSRAVDAVITAAREAVLPLVRSYVTASVTMDAELTHGSRASKPTRAGRAAGFILSIELAGPGSGPRHAGRMVLAKQQMSVWRTDDIVPAVRRAVATILRAHPIWRRLPEPGHQRPAAAGDEAAFAR